ncbi:MAG TPA: MarR family transcriptional regulator [Thermoanaerobaculia bacterium]
MAGTQADLIHDFLGSATVFSSTVREVVERKLLEEITRTDLTLSQFRLLKLVAMTDAQTIGDVARFLGVSNAAASKAVDKLVRRKLLRRSEAEADRREIRLALTEASRKLLETYDARRDEKLAVVFREFSREDLEKCAELLDRLSAGIVDHGADPAELCLQCGIYYRQKCIVRQLVKRNCFYHGKGKRPRASADDAGSPESEAGGT